ncbi:MAG: zinc-ribbon domain-containing protein [Anaerolineae bacterium]|nr:zinc-ribbon domain-containing protein [Anaerolineae bacterium]
MYCGACGNEIPKNSRFCPYCGHSTAVEPPVPHVGQETPGNTQLSQQETGFQTYFSSMTFVREEAYIRQDQQRQAIQIQWSPVIFELIEVLGKSTWGEGRYTVVKPELSAVWMVVHFSGSKSEQLYVILDSEEVDIDAFLSTGQPLPNQLVTAHSFQIVGVEESSAELSQSDLQRKLVIAQQHGFNKEALPDEIEKALEPFPYQIGEYDRRPWWKSALFALGGPATTLLAVLCLAGVVSIIVQSSLFSIEGLGAVLLVLVSIPFLIASILATRTTSFGRRFNKLPKREKRKAFIAILPGMALLAYFSIAFVIAIFVLIFILPFLGGQSEDAKVRSAVDKELRSRGL